MADLSNYTKLDVKLADVQKFSDLAEYGDVYYLATETSVDTSYEDSESYEYIHDESTWNASYANGVLKKYYEKYPEEDLWNTTENRAVNFNDRVYVGNITGTAGSFKAGWLERAQSITNVNDPSEVYYMARLNPDSPYYGTADEWKAQYDSFIGTWPLYSDETLTTPINKEFIIESLTFSNDCQHSWLGAINAPEAKWPWICPSFDTDVNAKLIFKYEGKDDVHPWYDAETDTESIFGIGEDKKIWGCASVAKVFKDDTFKVDVNGEGSSFDISKFILTLEHNTETSEELLVLVDANVFAELKEDDEDVDFYVVKGEDVPVDPDQPGGDTPDEPTPDTPDKPAEDDKKEERPVAQIIDDVLTRKGFDVENMTESEKVARATGLNFVDDEWIAAKKEEGTFEWYIPAGKAWE